MNPLPMAHGPWLIQPQRKPMTDDHSNDWNHQRPVAIKSNPSLVHHNAEEYQYHIASRGGMHNAQ